MILEGPKLTVSSSNIGESVEGSKKRVSPISSSNIEPEENEAIPPALLGLSRECFPTISEKTIV